MQTVTGYGIQMDDGTLIPFCTATPRGIMNVVIGLTGMSREQAETFFEGLSIVEVSVSLQTTEDRR